MKWLTLSLLLLASPASAHWIPGPTYHQASWKWFNWPSSTGDELLYTFNYSDTYTTGLPGITLAWNPSIMRWYGCGNENPPCGHCCSVSQCGLNPRQFYNVIQSLVIDVYATLTPANASPICADCTLLSLEIPGMGTYYYPFPDFGSHAHTPLPEKYSSEFWDWQSATRRWVIIAAPFPNMTLDQVESATFRIHIADPSGSDAYTGISAESAVSYGIDPYKTGVHYATHQCGQQGLEAESPPTDNVIYPTYSEGNTPPVTNVRRSSWGRIKTIYR